MGSRGVQAGSVLLMLQVSLYAGVQEVGGATVALNTKCLNCTCTAENYCKCGFENSLNL